MVRTKDSPKENPLSRPCARVVRQGQHSKEEMLCALVKPLENTQEMEKMMVSFFNLRTR